VVTGVANVCTIRGARKGLAGVAASIANAVFHAIGKRIRDLPIRVAKIIES
jgi:CO/xanthine dehydrogenase Mo-binding subunit